MYKATNVPDLETQYQRGFQGFMLSHLFHSGKNIFNMGRDASGEEVPLFLTSRF